MFCEERGPYGVRRAPKSHYGSAGVRSGWAGVLQLSLWPSGALAFRDASLLEHGEEEVSLPLWLSGSWLVRWPKLRGFCQFRVYQASAQNDAHLVTLHLPKDVRGSFEKVWKLLGVGHDWA